MKLQKNPTSRKKYIRLKKKIKNEPITDQIKQKTRLKCSFSQIKHKQDQSAGKKVPAYFGFTIYLSLRGRKNNLKKKKSIFIYEKYEKNNN